LASAIDTQEFARGLLLEMWDHDPGVATAKVTTPDGGTTERWVDMRDYVHLAVCVAATFRAGDGITLVEIVAAEAEDETDGSVTVIKTSGVVAADALADWVFLECSAEEIVHLGEAAGYELRYVAARITTQHAGDEAMVAYVALTNRPSTVRTPPTTIS